MIYNVLLIMFAISGFSYTLIKVQGTFWIVLVLNLVAGAVACYLYLCQDRVNYYQRKTINSLKDLDVARMRVIKDTYLAYKNKEKIEAEVLACKEWKEWETIIEDIIYAKDNETVQ